MPLSNDAIQRIDAKMFGYYPADIAYVKKIIEQEVEIARQQEAQKQVDVYKLGVSDGKILEKANIQQLVTLWMGTHENQQKSFMTHDFINFILENNDGKQK